MRRLNLEALLYCIVWVGLALLGWQLAGIRVGLLLSIGLFLIIMPTSAVILSRTGSFRAERTVRWGILAVAGIGLISYAGRGGLEALRQLHRPHMLAMLCDRIAVGHAGNEIADAPDACCLVVRSPLPFWRKK
jgi:hypothetical protein